MKLIDQILAQMETHRMVMPSGIFLRKDDVRHVLEQVLKQYAPDHVGDHTAVVEVDWGAAPAWAKWWAMDCDGSANWFKHRPVTFCGRWCCAPQKHGHEFHRKFKGPFSNWELNIRERPRVGA